MKNLIKIFKALRALKLAFDKEAKVEFREGTSKPNHLYISITYGLFYKDIPKWLLKHSDSFYYWGCSGYNKSKFFIGKFSFTLSLKFIHMYKTRDIVEYTDVNLTTSELESVKYENCTPFAKDKNDIDWNNELQES